MPENEIIQLTATQIAASVRTRHLRAVDVMQAFITRTERLEPLLNTYAHFMPEQAMAKARGVDACIARGEDPGPLARLTQSSAMRRVSSMIGAASSKVLPDRASFCSHIPKNAPPWCKSIRRTTSGGHLQNHVASARIQSTSKLLQVG